MTLEISLTIALLVVAILTLILQRLGRKTLSKP